MDAERRLIFYDHQPLECGQVVSHGIARQPRVGRDRARPDWGCGVAGQRAEEGTHLVRVAPARSTGTGLSVDVGVHGLFEVVDDEAAIGPTKLLGPAPNHKQLQDAAQVVCAARARRFVAIE